MAAAIALIAFACLTGAMLFFLLRMRKKAEAEAAGGGGEAASADGAPRGRADERTTASELPFEEIKDSMIYLGDDRYRMCLECGSVNLGLKTDAEQEAVELNFQRCLQSLNFPFSFYVQTREVDNSAIIDKTEKDALAVARRYPEMEKYAANYIASLRAMDERSRDAKAKKKYLIVAYDDLGKMDVPEGEKWDLAFKELESRCQGAMYALRNVGIRSHIMDSNEIAEMVFRAYNKGDPGLLEGLKSGEMASLFVDSERHRAEATPSQKMDLAITEFFNQLDQGVTSDPDADPYFVEAANEMEAIVNMMRDKAGGYYKTYGSSDWNGTYEERAARFLGSAEEGKAEAPEDGDELFDL